MHPNAALLARFYDAFARRDAETMAACYHDDVSFEDPVFGPLRGEDARDMWRMLCARGKDLSVTHEVVEADDVDGEARWVARYTFGRPGRPVTNRVHARFEFRDGRIARHLDTFSFWGWSRQALGPAGLALGWAPPLRARVRRDALAGLAAFRAARGR